MIKVYTSPSCTSCRKARAWLQANQLEFEEKNIFAEPLTEVRSKRSWQRLKEEFKILFPLGRNLRKSWA
jgi:arsenate reductase-like glutaredoxin family protein